MEHRRRVTRTGLHLLATAFVAVLMLSSAGGDVLAADDPTASPPAGTSLSSVVWQQSLSSDGSPLSFQDILARDEGFAALGWPQGSHWRGDDVVVPIWLSDDAVTWRMSGSIPLPSKRTRPSGLASLDGGLYVIGMEGSQLAVWRSRAGAAWQRVKDRSSFSANPPGTGRRFNADLDSIVSGHGSIVVSGSYWTRDPDPSVEPVVWTSADGRRWKRGHPTLPPPDNGVYALSAAPSGFVGVIGTNKPAGCSTGEDGNLPVRSKNGRDWHRVKRADLVCGLGAMTFDAARGWYYSTAAAADDGTAVVLASDDLRAWDEVYRLPPEFDGSPWSAYSGGVDTKDGSIVVVGEADWEGGRDGGTVWAAVSSGDDEWHLTADWPSDEMSDVGIHAWAMDDERVVIAIGAEVWYADLTEFAPEVGAEVSQSSE